MNQFVLAIMLAVTTPAGHMAALIGHDRVTADYPGFKRDEGDISVLAAHAVSGVNAIVIRKIAVLPRGEEGSFDLAAAVNIARAHEHVPSLEAVTRRGPIANARGIQICGRHGYAFSQTRDLKMETQVEGTQRWSEDNSYVLVRYGNDVWQARYERQNEPGIAAITERSDIEFVANFCVQKNYK